MCVCPHSISKVGPMFMKRGHFAGPHNLLEVKTLFQGCGEGVWDGKDRHVCSCVYVFVVGFSFVSPSFHE